MWSALVTTSYYPLTSENYLPLIFQAAQYSNTFPHLVVYRSTSPSPPHHPTQHTLLPPAYPKHSLTPSLLCQTRPHLQPATPVMKEMWPFFAQLCNLYLGVTWESVAQRDPPSRCDLQTDEQKNNKCCDNTTTQITKKKVAAEYFFVYFLQTIGTGTTGNIRKYSIYVL